MKNAACLPPRRRLRPSRSRPARALTPRRAVSGVRADAGSAEPAALNHFTSSQKSTTLQALRNQPLYKLSEIKRRRVPPVGRRRTRAERGRARCRRRGRGLGRDLRRRVLRRLRLRLLRDLRERPGERDETCPVSTERWTRRVHLVRGGGGGGGAAWPPPGTPAAAAPRAAARAVRTRAARARGASPAAGPRAAAPPPHRAPRGAPRCAARRRVRLVRSEGRGVSD